MSNVSTLQTLVDWANAGVVISLALSFVFGAATVILGKRLGAIKDAQAETAQRDLELAVATQQERAAKAEQSLEEIKKRQEPRTVPCGIVVPILKNAPRGRANILYQDGKPETFLFAMTLWHCLARGPVAGGGAGWEVPEPIPVASVISKSATAQGDILFVTRRNWGERPEYVTALWTALETARLRVAGYSDPSLPDDTLRLMIPAQ